MIDHSFPLWIVLIMSTLITFSLAFTKAFQSRNIVFGHEGAAFCTSWVVTTLEVGSVGMFVLGGWWIILSAGIGGSVGTVAAMRAHSRIFKKG